MADQQQSNLNATFNGPSIPPPPSHNPKAPKRRRSCAFCLLSVLLKTILVIFIIALVLAVIAVVAFVIAVRPTRVKFHVTEANLTEFGLTPNNNNNNVLNYNLDLNVTVRNPNRKIAFYFDVIDARFLYYGERMKSVSLPNYLQRRKSTNFLNPVFKGNQLVFFDDDVVRQFRNENATGVFKLDVNFHMDIRFRLGDFIMGDFGRTKAKCDVRVPLNGADGKFESSRCSFSVFSFH